MAALKLPKVWGLGFRQRSLYSQRAVGLVDRILYISRSCNGLLKGSGGLGV